jgi:hypothetical protein
VASQLDQMAHWFVAPCKAALRLCLPAAAVVFSAVSVSSELLELSVTEAEDEYRLRIVAILDAPEDYVYQVITDYRHAYRINPAITSIEILPAERDGVTRVKNRSEHRVGLFSFEVEWAGDVLEAGQRRLDITTIPEISSFESGSALWEIRPQGDRAWVLHESTLKPKFSVVPLIGDYLMKRHMKRETLATFHRIECHARSMLDRDMQEDPQHLKVVLNEKHDCIEGHSFAAAQAAEKR